MKKSSDEGNKFLYILSLILFIILVFSITITYLFIFKENNGSVDIVNKYYDVVFNNVMTNDDIIVKVNNNNIYVSVKDINELSTPKTFYIDMVNIGNLNAVVDGVYISNMSDYNIGKYLNVETSILKDDVLKGSQKKKLMVKFSYLGHSKVNKGFKFNINYLFKEVIL